MEQLREQKQTIDSYFDISYPDGRDGDEVYADCTHQFIAQTKRERLDVKVVFSAARRA